MKKRIECDIFLYIMEKKKLEKRERIERLKKKREIVPVLD